jgi:hypothetical protein
MLERFIPRERAESVAAVDIAGLTERGFRAAILDLDNTVAVWNSLEIPPAIERWVQDAKAAGLRLCILSNSSKRRRVHALAERLGVTAFARPLLKPFGSGYRRALAHLQADPAHTVAIGDQLFTDVFGGNRLGLHTILVEPLSGEEFVTTKVSRLGEVLVRWLMRRRGLLDDGAGKGAAEVA